MQTREKGFIALRGEEDEEEMGILGRGDADPFPDTKNTVFFFLPLEFFG